MRYPKAKNMFFFRPGTPQEVKIINNKTVAELLPVVTEVWF